MKETIYYNIGDIVFEIISDLPYAFPDGNASNFRVEQGRTDFTYVFRKIQSIPELLGDFSLIDRTIISHELLNKNGISFRGFLWKDKFYDTVLELREKNGIVSYLSSDILMERYKNGFNFVNYLNLESVFSKFGAMVLHSSHIVINGKAILFSAASGVGKSTQADLWRQYAGAQIINGDRTLLRKKADTWNAYGCPMCGTSNIHLQSTAPIYAIVMLEQGQKNKILELSSKEAFSLLYPQITIQRWNQEMVLKNINLLDDLISEVPIFKYSCTKTFDAVLELKKNLNL